jgi:hypothetical protein
MYLDLALLFAPLAARRVGGGMAEESGEARADREGVGGPVELLVGGDMTREGGGGRAAGPRLLRLFRGGMAEIEGPFEAEDILGEAVCARTGGIAGEGASVCAPP